MMRDHKSKAALSRLLSLGAGIVMLAHGSAAVAQGAGDPVKGKQVFMRCSVCHAVDDKPGKLGPTLANVVNRKAGTVPGAKYSPAMKASKLTWTTQNLDKYLTAPRTVVPGTTMMAPPLTVATDRANLIAYLTTISKAPPAKKR